LLSTDFADFADLKEERQQVLLDRPHWWAMPAHLRFAAAILAAMPLVLHGQGTDPCARLRPLLGVLYGEDAVTDAAGRTVTFARPDRPLAAPALNCSGFVVEAARRILAFRGGPDAAARDRRGDSGADAASGRDWDFGYDLALNVSEGRARSWIGAEGQRNLDAPARTLEGWRVQDRGAWDRALAALPAGHAALATFQRGPGPSRRRWHHLGLVLRDAAGRAWLYQTLPRGRGHRLDLSGSAGFTRLCTMFGPGERVVLLAVEPVTAP
jgi:hypothetical protein